jgi:hypothetical protein
MTLYQQIESAVNRLPIDNPHIVIGLAYHYVVSGMSIDAAIDKTISEVTDDIE